MDFYELKDENLEMVIGGLEMPFYRGSDDDAEAGRKEFNKLEMTHF